VFQGLVFLVVLYSDSLYGKIPFFKEKPIITTSPSPPASPGEEPVVTA
jgi:simple sugar transport system permease protein